MYSTTPRAPWHRLLSNDLSKSSVEASFWNAAIGPKIDLIGLSVHKQATQANNG